MVILKNLTISQKRDVNGTFSVLMQKCPALNQPAVIFEAGAIVSLNFDETKAIKKENTYTKMLDAYACLGILQDSYAESKTVLYLVLVTGCSSTGKIRNSEIFRITDVEVILLNGPGDQDLVREVKRLLNSGCFYFSISHDSNLSPYDLTLCAQRSLMSAETDHRFFWNRILFRHFERFNIDTSTWLVKIVCGGLNISTVYIGSIQAKACLFSRLSSERAGTRFNVRGVNDHGHVANFVETEQVIFINQTVYSFVMIRGSIPLFWEQPGVQVGSHRIKMSRGSELSQPAYDKHNFLLKERYEDVVFINLLSQKDSESHLSQMFNAHHQVSDFGSMFQLYNFDYHALCPRGHKENLEKFLVTDLNYHCDRFGFLIAETSNYDGTRNIIQLQKGVFRVNCLDCLDRTNSVQLFIGIKMLEKFACYIQRLDQGNLLPRLQDTYLNMWIHNGDQVSRIYAGTGALEGKNKIKDGALSVARTIQNNLFDDDKQGAIDVLTLGRSLNRDYAYRSASLLPHYYMFAPSRLLVGMCDRYLDFCLVEKLKIVVGTWNVNANRHFDNQTYSRARPLTDWLVNYRAAAEYGSAEIDLINQYKSSDPVDIYVVGFQEIVDLNASNIVASSTQNQKDWLLEIQKALLMSGHQYLLVTSVQLVGVCLFVFVRKSLAPHITDVYNDQVKTGLGGATGNKGGVAVRFRYKATSLCFICAHFAAGQSQVKERNDDYAEITRRLQFSMGRSVNSHDYIFWCGDFNYRLDKISNEEARRAAANQDYQLLLAHDQLKISQASGTTFRGYIEGDIQFAPTYKYDAFSNDYDSSEKCRVPAYTDRIMFKKRHPTYASEILTDKSQIKFYNRVELLSSDHRPIVGEFSIDVLSIDKNLRRQVFDEVVLQGGPLDATATVQIEGPERISDNKVVTAILRLLAEEAGEITLPRFITSMLLVIFRDGISALKALKLNNTIISSENIQNIRLIIDLKTTNWREAIYSELSNNKDNSTNLVTGEPPKIYLDDDEDETAQNLNFSIGPEVNPETFCLSNAFLVPSGDKDLLVQGIPLPSTSTSPDPPPQRPPPPSPRFNKMKPPSRNPPPVPTSPKPTKILFSSQPTTPKLPPPHTPKIQNNDESSNIIEVYEKDLTAFNLSNLSSSLDFEELPPPTSAPPQLPTMQPLPAHLFVEDYDQRLSNDLIGTHSTIKSQPPPIPARSNFKVYNEQ